MKKQYRGNELRDLRAQHGLTQKSMAEFLEIEYRTYLGWEYDNHPLDDLKWNGVLRKFEKKHEA